ncbi:MAG: WGR domain-containing protein [Alphaproteobacteria bacterium]|nr:WGR domain-containing protein [Alphaproteobacteria bacterium]MCB9696153.1 WGR domain-containing protein [Alphaproteobacteria bacterium]
MRRFEYIQGNTAKFWEVARRGATLTTTSGRIGGAGKTRTRQLADYMAAEQEFDRLIRDHLRRGYVEVHEATEHVEAMEDRALVLRRGDGKEEIELPPAATRYILWRMVEIGVMDKQIPAPDLLRWAERAARRMRLAEVPGSEHPEYEAFVDLFLEFSAADRAAESGQHSVVGAYKLAEGSEWILTPQECRWLGDASRNRTPRRHKVTTNQEQWLAEWIAFVDGAAKHGGATVTLQ